MEDKHILSATPPESSRKTLVSLVPRLIPFVVEPIYYSKSVFEYIAAKINVIYLFRDIKQKSTV